MDDTMFDDGTEQEVEDFNIGEAAEVFGVNAEIIEQVQLDTDGDGYTNVARLLMSSGGTMTLMDQDNDGIGDVLQIDLDGDGLPELLLVQDGDNDNYLLAIDESGDGIFDAAETVQMTKAQLDNLSPELVLMMEQTLGWSNVAVDTDQPGTDPDGAVVDTGGEDPEVLVPDMELVDNPGMAGDPDQWSDNWFNQAENGNCVPASVTQIVSEYTGIDFQDEQAFVELALENGFFLGDDNANGMTIEDSVQLLNLSGIPATLESGNLDVLAEALDEGRGVMVFVDSGEYWTPGAEMVEDNIADHCVVVSGIDAENGIVYLSDPGHPEGDQMEVPLEVFADAWADSQNSMIVCDQPAPSAEVDERVMASAAIDWAVDRPWIMLPVVLSAPSAEV